MATLTPRVVNGWASTVQAGSTAIGSATATGVVVATGDGAALGTIGTDEFIPGVITDTTGAIKEYIWFTGRSTDTLTVVRQAEDSTRFPASTTSIQSGYKVYAVGTVRSFSAPRVATPGQFHLMSMNADPRMFTAGGAMSVGWAFAQRVPLPWATASATNLHFALAAGASASCTGAYLALYDSTGAMLGQTSNWNTSAQSAGFKTVPIASGPITVTGGASTFGWIAHLFVGAAPSAARIQFYDTASGNAGLAVAESMVLRLGSGLTALPASFTPSAMTQDFNMYWVGMS